MIVLFGPRNLLFAQEPLGRSNPDTLYTRKIQERKETRGKRRTPRLPRAIRSCFSHDERICCEMSRRRKEREFRSRRGANARYETRDRTTVSLGRWKLWRSTDDGETSTTWIHKGRDRSKHGSPIRIACVLSDSYAVRVGLIIHLTYG